jgi:hypothetical protein
MGSGGSVRGDQRRSPRVDVLTHVRGQIVPLGTPILVSDLSRSGFAVISQQPFRPGETLAFRLTASDAAPVLVSARAIHTRPLPGKVGFHLSGFRFVPGKLMGLVPHALIDQLIAAVTTPALRCL